jgi:osmotically-inducible protein OsmY
MSKTASRIGSPIDPLKILVLAFALALPLVSCAAISGQETAGQYFDDTGITSKIKASLVQEQSLNGLQISVETMQGTVQLSGFVDTRAQKDQAGKIAAGISGVKAVQNNILVKTQ